ncbi:hypothetical protein NQ318_005724 [Aromia moschata]|uniref:Uncharacterized protein n=1 Tax=Aromia moschata TaxID=1265417 RepID=A0AAV8YTV9_9CUCU|nr:hypothetical protein NQ318_005724 [Aromia moschata]
MLALKEGYRSSPGRVKRQSSSVFGLELREGPNGSPEEHITSNMSSRKLISVRPAKKIRVVEPQRAVPSWDQTRTGYPAVPEAE